MKPEKLEKWRESASLILIAPTQILDSRDYDYNVLLLKRSDHTALIPNQCVFPGGIFDHCDETIEWLQYFQQFGVQQKSLTQLFVCNAHRPRILAPQGNGCYDRFFKKTHIWAREISLRITAIRETFEEVGILLCRSKAQLLAASTGYANLQNDFDIKYWQKLVHNDSSAFLRLCKELQVVPDLWSLYEWSAWASPAPIKKGYETVFFITFLTEMPQLLMEKTEVKECMWRTPTELMQFNRNAEVFLLPPQFYELSRLMSVKSINKLLKFAMARNSKGITLYLPVGYACADGIVTILPGDDCYLQDPRTPTRFERSILTIAEFALKSKNLHRMENPGMSNCIIRLNVEPLDGHLRPANDSELEKSKL